MQSVERKDGRPMKIYGNQFESTGPNLKSQAITAPRNLERIKKTLENMLRKRKNVPVWNLQRV